MLHAPERTYIYIYMGIKDALQAIHNLFSVFEDIFKKKKRNEQSLHSLGIYLNQETP